MELIKSVDALTTHTWVHGNTKTPKARKTFTNGKLKEMFASNPFVISMKKFLQKQKTVKYAKSVLNIKDEQLITDHVRSHSVSIENT